MLWCQVAKTSERPTPKTSVFLSMHPYYIQVWYSGLRRDGNTRWDHAGLPVSVNRQTANPNKVCRLTPIDMAKASTPPVGQWPAGWQLHTLTVKVLVLERAGEPLSVTTTGRRYWVRSLRVKVLRRATMPAVLSRNEKRCTFQYSSKKHEYRFWGNSKLNNKRSDTRNLS